MIAAPRLMRRAGQSAILVADFRVKSLKIERFLSMPRLCYLPLRTRKENLRQLRRLVS